MRDLKLTAVVAAVFAAITAIVAGAVRWELASSFNLEITVESTKADEAQLFWDPGNGFDEIHSIRMPITGTGHPEILSFPLPKRHRAPTLRFAPLAEFGSLRVDRVEVRRRTGETVASLLPTSLGALANVTTSSRADGAVEVETTPGSSGPLLSLTLPELRGDLPVRQALSSSLAGALWGLLLGLVCASVLTAARRFVTVDSFLGPDTPLTSDDLAVFGLVSVFLYFGFQHFDLGITAGAAINWLDGHFFDFYEAARDTVGLNNYLPSTTLVFALWDVPLKVLGVMAEPRVYTSDVLMWLKVLPVLVVAFSVVVLYRLGRELSLTAGESKELVLLWVTSPILVFSQLVFGQYDIFTVAVFLVALVFYYRRRLFVFALLAGVATTFKYFPAFLFFPLLLLAEKKLKPIALATALFAAPVAIEVATFFHSNAFREGVINFHAAARPMLETTVGSVGFDVLVLLWSLVCAAAYYIVPRDEADLRRWSLYSMMLTSGLVFSLVLWHPQWVLFITPFFALTTFVHPRARYFVLLDVATALAFVGFSVTGFPDNVDAKLFQNGLIGRHLLSVSVPVKTIASMIPFGNRMWLYFSLFVATLLVQFVLKFPLFPGAQSDRPPRLAEYVGPFRARALAVVVAFAVPAVVANLLTWAKTVRG